ncbi:hypothetical protein PSY62_23785, partial [Shigella flexneri]|nr:hypothetical protein [Shigella flexneri]
LRLHGLNNCYGIIQSMQTQAIPVLNNCYGIIQSMQTQAIPVLNNSVAIIQYRNCLRLHGLT